MAFRRRRRLWTTEEDNKLRKFKIKYPDESWEFIAKKARLRRDPGSCWERWKNYLRPDLYKGPFSQEDDNTIVRLLKEAQENAQGNRWTFIATQLQPQRVPNDVKNYWHNHLQKKRLSDLEGYLLTDEGTSDHSVRGDDFEPSMAESASLIPNVDPNARLISEYMIRYPEINELGRQLFTDNETSDHSVRKEDLVALMADLASEIR